MAASEAEVKRLQAELAEAKKNAPPPASKVMSVRDEAETGDYFIAIRGNPHNLGDPVPRGFLSVLENVPESRPAAIPAGQSGRLQLARWIASEDNPLTPRVFVNRVWLHLFGAGLVHTPDNFGKMGQPPTHPALLDYLARDFAEHGWSVKRLIRQIVLSHTFRQGSQTSASVAAADPENRLLSRMSRRRLDAEAIRDSVLSFSGRLDLAVGGRSFPKGSKTEFGFNFDSVRRSVYVPVFRNTLHELFEVFDFANPNLVSGQRITSTLPTQALYLMNSPFAMDEVRAAAKRLLAAEDLDDSQRIDLAYRRALGRALRAAERELTLRSWVRAPLSTATPSKAGWRPGPASARR